MVDRCIRYQLFSGYGLFKTGCLVDVMREGLKEEVRLGKASEGNVIGRG